MTDREKELQMTPSQMIRRAARASRQMTMEERWVAIQESEVEAERVKARFAEHGRSCQAPNAAD